MQQAEVVWMLQAIGAHQISRGSFGCVLGLTFEPLKPRPISWPDIMLRVVRGPSRSSSGTCTSPVQSLSSQHTPTACQSLQLSDGFYVFESETGVEIHGLLIMHNIVKRLGCRIVTRLESSWNVHNATTCRHSPNHLHLQCPAHSGQRRMQKKSPCHHRIH